MRFSTARSKRLSGSSVIVSGRGVVGARFGAGAVAKPREPDRMFGVPVTMEKNSNSHRCVVPPFDIPKKNPTRLSTTLMRMYVSLFAMAVTMVSSEITSMNPNVVALHDATNFEARVSSDPTNNDGQQDTGGNRFIVTQEREYIAGGTGGPLNFDYAGSQNSFTPSTSQPGNSYLIYLNDEINRRSETNAGIITFENEILGVFTEPSNTIYMEGVSKPGGTYPSASSQKFNKRKFEFNTGLPPGTSSNKDWFVISNSNYTIQFGADNPNDTGDFIRVITGASPSPPAAPPPATTALGDPHLTFPNGARADFRGVPGRVFAFVSAPSFAVNMLFTESAFRVYDAIINGTYMTEMYVRCGNTLIVHNATNTTPTGYGWHAASIKCADQPWKYVYPHSSHRCATGDASLSVEYATSTSTCKSWKVVSTVQPVARYISGSSRNLDIRVCGDQVAHGVLGQNLVLARNGSVDTYPVRGNYVTRAQAEGAIDGTYADYIVDTAYDTQFKYTEFHSNTTTYTARYSVDARSV